MWNGPIREFPLSNDPISKWANNVKDISNRQSLIKSSDFLSVTTHAGTHLSIHPKFKSTPNYLHYAGAWNITSSYSVNDVVTVFDEPQTADIQITQLLSSFYKGYTSTDSAWIGTYVSPYGGSFQLEIAKYLPTPGTYICIAGVPSLNLMSDLVALNTITPSMVTNPPASLWKYTRFPHVNYFPIWPASAEVAELNVDDPDLLNGAYWQLMSLMPRQSTGCIDGVNVKTFTDQQTAPTGSYINVALNNVGT